MYFVINTDCKLCEKHKNTITYLKEIIALNSHRLKTLIDEKNIYEDTIKYYINSLNEKNIIIGNEINKNDQLKILKEKYLFYIM